MDRFTQPHLLKKTALCVWSGEARKFAQLSSFPIKSRSVEEGDTNVNVESGVTSLHTAPPTARFRPRKSSGSDWISPLLPSSPSPCFPHACLIPLQFHFNHRKRELTIPTIFSHTWYVVTPSACLPCSVGDRLLTGQAAFALTTSVWSAPQRTLDSVSGSIGSSF